MLSDRSYMRDDYQPERTSLLTWLLCGLAGAYIIELILISPWLKLGGTIFGDIAVSIEGLRQWKLWTPLTYWILHSPANPFHVVLVLAGLFMLGRGLNPVVGPKKFLGLFSACLLVGALFWTAINWRHGGNAGVLYGATAGVYGLLALYASLFPNREMNFLLFFFFPVTLKPKHLVLGLLLLDLFALAFYEIPGSQLPFAMTPSAHLGGMFVGWLYYRFAHESEWLGAATRRDLRLPRWLKRAKKPPAEPRAETTALPPSRDDIRAEVDRILDKINSHGFGALTPEEKRRLDDAKHLLSRR